MKSLQLDNCLIINSNFNQANFDEIKITDCTFENSEFMNASMKQSRFIASKAQIL